MEEKKFNQAEYVAGYLKEKYEQYCVWTPKGEIQRFKAACMAAGEKPATVVRRFMAEYAEKILGKS